MRPPTLRAGQPDDAAATAFAGGGDMGARMAGFDWAATPLGAVSRWPQNLRTCVRIILTSRQPMFVWWGPDLINLYNDAYRSILGGKHPEALGQPARVVWREIWEQVGPRAEATMHGDEGTYDEALLLIMERNGYPEETYYTFSYSPVPDDTGGAGGIICANTDDTQRIIGERRLALLRELAARTADARTAEEACRLGAMSLETEPRDLPFALIYRADELHGPLRLVGRSGIDGAHPLAPAVVDPAAADGWPFGRALREHVIGTASLAAGAGGIPAGAWSRPPDQVAVVPVAAAGDTGRPGALVVGLNPFRPFDDEYRTFLSLVAGQISAAITNAEAYEAERKRAEALAEIDRAKTAFFSNVSHEFRTPLTLILGPAEDVLAERHGTLSEAQRSALESLQRNALRLQKLVNSLLDFSRIEAGRVQASYEPVDLAALTRDLASVFRAAIERAGMTFTVDAPPLPQPIHVDRDMWEKILLNLLSNAFKFTFQGGITVSLRDEGNVVALRVQDTGEGIPAAELPRLFERFHRVEGTRSRTHEGSGIGLALVQELVKMHGGAIDVRSTVGAGTTFEVTIPKGTAHLPAERLNAPRTLATTSIHGAAFVEEARRWITDDDASPDVLAATAEPPPGAGPRDGARILLADDNADMREYVRRLLSARWQVEAVADGRAALEAARRRKPDLVLTDVMMPNLDGFGLLAALRADPSLRALPVVMLSARAGEEAKVEGLQASADDYLVKPFSARELLARIETHLMLARYRAAAEAERLKLHTLFMNAPAAIAILRGPDHVFELANRPFLEITGVHEILGRPVRDAVPEVIGQGYVDVLDGVYRTGQAHAANEALVQVDRDGTGRLQDIYVNFVLQPSLDTAGAVDGVLVFAFDVTQLVLARRKAEDEHRAADQAQRQAEAAVQLRDNFLSIASHELRTPLTSLLLQVEGAERLLQREVGGPAGERGVRKLSGARAAGRRLERLVQGLLDVSRIAAGRLELQPERVDLAAIAREVCERFSDEAARVGSALEAEAVHPVIGNWDPLRLDQVVTNLVSNAIKYGDRKPIRVRVSAAEGGARLEVIDLGIGIDSGDQQRIFGQFERAVPDRNYGGLGLGLWISRQIVEAMGGRIEVNSAPARGSTFAVYLPR